MSDPGSPEDPPRPPGGGASAGASTSPPFLNEDARQQAADQTREQRPAGGAGTLSPSHLFIKRPIATSLLMAAVFLAGIIGFQFLPLSALPEVDYPTIQVQTFYPGASPEVMTSYVTAPLERQLGEMPSLSRMSSISSAGASIITLQFGLDLSLDVAEQEVQAAINAANSLLPSGLPAPPVYAKVNPADAPILTLALSSKSLPLTQVEDLADTRMASKISQIAGVGLVSISGGERPAVRIQANPMALASYGLTLEVLRSAISNANVNGAKGQIDGQVRAYTINANDQLTSTDDYANLVIAYKNGAPIRLKDVATIVNGAENNQLDALNNTTPSVILNIQRQPGANVIAVVDRIKKLLPSLQENLPAAVDVSLTTDRTITIRASVSDVEFELMLSVILVVFVIFLFLRNIAATFISGVSVPLSLVGTFAAMYLLGFSLNNLTLMALTIATGFVVDDAIVMIENISRHIEMGANRKEAAFIGSGEIGFTIISLTLSLLAVLIPLLFMGDVVGRLFREFAITLAVTIVISAVVSLTLVPSLCALWLGPPQEDERTAFGRFNRRLDKGFQYVLKRYDVGLTWVLRNQGLTLIVAFATFLVTALLYVIVPKGLFPTQDTGLIQGVSEASQTVSFAAMGDRQRQLADAILKDPDVVNVQSFVGVDAQNETLNEGRVLIDLKPLGKRHTGSSEIIRRLQQETRGVPGITLYMQPVQDLTIDANVSRTQYQFVLEGTDTNILADLAAKLVTKLKTLPHLEQVSADTQNQGLAAYVQVDRNTAGRLGISFATIDNALYDAFGQEIVSTIYTQSNEYRVILEASPQVQHSVDALNSIYLQSTAGTSVPLSSIATIRQQPSALVVSHVGQFPAATISFNLAKGVALGTAVNQIKAAEADIGVPSSVTTTFLGAAEAFQSSLSNELWLILAAIIAIYIVLGVLYESFIHPLTILSTLPSAAIGALLALLITGQDLGVIGIIGIILLIGIVKKNAIMMTTMAALLGALPLMLGGGMGSELRFPLGVSIVGGLLASQLLTLFTTPVIYIAFDNIATRFGRKDPETPVRYEREQEGRGQFPDPEGYPS